MNVVHQSRRNHHNMKSNNISKNGLNQTREKVTLKSRMHLSQGSSKQMPILATKNFPCLLREKGLNISMNHFLRHIHPNLKVYSIKIMLMLVQMRVNQRIILLVQYLSIIIIIVN